MHVNRLAIVRSRRADCLERSSIGLAAVSGINLHRRLEGQRYGKNLRQPIGCLD
ncbi:MAG: hypothetical protein QF773_09420 [Lentisphaeria bacterium]|jgi:hypothetical protein|nr:hypothetical protein [Lentisphaeria bacterium]